MFSVGEYRVVFQHQKTVDNKPLATVCKIEMTKDEGWSKLVAVGETYCSKGDQFNRNTGRKIALARALKSFPRDERQDFWDAYYLAHGGKW